MNEIDQILFSRFLAGVLQSPVPGDEDVHPTTARAGPIVDDILNRVIASHGTAQLTGVEIRNLRSYESRPAINHNLRAMIMARRYPAELLALFSHTTSSDLLISFLLVLLHHRQMQEIIQLERELLTRYKTFIALSFLIWREKIPAGQPEHDNKNNLRNRIMRVNRELKTLVETIVDQTGGFYTTHQMFLHGEIEGMLRHQIEWRFNLIDSVISFVNPHVPQINQRPTPLEVLEYRWLKVLEQLHPRRNRQELRRRAQRGDSDQEIGQSDLDYLIDKLEEEIRSLQREIRETPSQDRDRLREDLAQTKEEFVRRRAQRQNLGREMNKIRNRLRGRRLALLERYFTQESNERYNRGSRENRDRFLQEFDRLLPYLTSRSLSTADDRENWLRYRWLLEELVTGKEGVGIQLFVNSLLARYWQINENRRIGLGTGARDIKYDAVTRPGHDKSGENPIDLNTEVYTEIVVIAPEEFTIPGRLPQLRQREQPMKYRYQGSFIPLRGVEHTTNRDEILYNLAYLLRTRGQNKPDSGQVDEIIVANYTNDLAPAYLLHGSAVRAFDLLGVQMIMKGLAFYSLADVRNDQEIDQERTAVLRRWEELIKQLNGWRVAEIFDLRRGRAVRGRLSVNSIIRLSRSTPWRDRTAVWNAALTVLKSPEQSDPLDSDGLVHRIWRLVRDLAHAGASPYHHGRYVTIQHRYVSADDSHEQLVVEVLYSHLAAIYRTIRPGHPVNRCARLGAVGMTGNARNAHPHMEIRLEENGRLIGTVLPHEFFPRTNQVRCDH